MLITFSRKDVSLGRYLHEIGNEALISKEKEVELACEIRNGSRKALALSAYINETKSCSVSKLTL